jgi:AraC-like DNA-binding protein
MCVLYSVVIGRLGLRQSGREVVLDPSDIALCDLDRPFALSSAETAGPTEWLTVRFPRHMAPLVGGLAPEATANRMCGRRGAGRMLNSVLRAMAEELIEDQATIDVRFANVVLELTGALLAAHGAERMASVDSLLETVQAFIERHLDAAELTPAWIAAAHHISVRQLHRVFKQHNLTVAGWIRHRRLESWRRDLGRQECDHLPVQAIAARCGLPTIAHANRLFRAAYGTAPGAYRRNLADPAGSCAEGQ